MEDLIALVAASFARHGIECPPADNDGKVVEKRPSSRACPEQSRGVPDDPAALPEHNFRKNLQGDPAP